MDRFSPDVNETPSTPVEEQVPHSGIHHNEKPDFPGAEDLNTENVRVLTEKGAEFDSVPQVLVDRSVKEGLVLPTAQTTEQAQKPEKSSNSRRNKLIAWIAGGALALGGGGIAVERTLNANADNDTAKDPKGNSQVNEEQKPGNNEEKPPVVEKPADNKEIDTSLSAEELSKTVVVDIIGGWENNGANDDLRMKRLEANETWDVFLKKQADVTATEQANKYFVEGWENNENLKKFVDISKVQNFDTLMGYTSTAWNSDTNPENKEGYRTWYTVDSSTKTVDDSGNTVLEVKSTYHDNSDMNSMSKFKGLGKALWTITLTEDGRISNIQITSLDQ